VAQIVIEFVSESVAVLVRFLSAAVRPVNSVRVLRCLKKDSLEYEPFEGDFQTLILSATNGEVCSAIMFSAGRFRHGLFTCPNFNRSKLSSWMGTIELTDDTWQPILTKLMEIPQLRVVCVTEEEGLELTDAQLSASTFPWTDPSILACAVRRDDGSWEVGGAERPSYVHHPQ
jgi:hypothetical protein